jgi:hypothetical protein
MSQIIQGLHLAFLEGFSLLYPAVLVEERRRLQRPDADLKAFEADWEAIGDDFRKAFKTEKERLTGASCK